MNEQAAAQKTGGFRLPANAQEFWALALSLLVVFVLIQFGSPLIRELDFLDQKLRDYFIGISFAAFPVVHGQLKRRLSSFTPQAEPRMGLAPWYVTGVIAATLLFAWNQFASLLGGLATGLALGQLAQGANLDDVNTASAVMISILAVSLPLSAIASVFAGVLLNRATRSHVFAALALAAVFFVALNVFTNWLFEPELFWAQIENATNEGAFGIAMFAVGIALVGVVIFVFGAAGIVISWIRRERSLGQVMDAARRLTPSEREVLAGEISQRLAAARSPVSPVQAAAAAEP